MFAHSLDLLIKQHPVKHAKGRAKLDGVLVAEATNDTPKKVAVHHPKQLSKTRSNECDHL